MSIDSNLVANLSAATRAGQSAYLKASMMRDADLFAHAFFEGSDDYDYYFGYVANKFAESRNTEAYLCNGKDEVLVARDLLVRNRPDLVSLFFVDCDYDRYIGIDPAGVGTYVTDYYSVESYMATPSHIDVIARAKCLLDPDVHAHHLVIRNFQPCFELFAQRLRNVSAAMIWLRQTGAVAHFGTLRLKQFGTVLDTGEFVAKPDHIGILLTSAGLNGLEVDVEAVSLIEANLANEQPLNWVRGKFVLEFVAAYFHRCVEMLRLSKTKRLDGRNVRQHPATSPNQITLCGEVGGTALVVPSLAAFLATF